MTGTLVLTPAAIGGELPKMSKWGVYPHPRVNVFSSTTQILDVDAYDSKDANSKDRAWATFCALWNKYDLIENQDVSNFPTSDPVDFAAGTATQEISFKLPSQVSYVQYGVVGWLISITSNSDNLKKLPNRIRVTVSVTGNLVAASSTYQLAILSGAQSVEHIYLNRLDAYQALTAADGYTTSITQTGSIKRAGIIVHDNAQAVKTRIVVSGAVPDGYQLSVQPIFRTQESIRAMFDNIRTWQNENAKLTTAE